MNKLIVANWKMNPPTFREAEKLFRALTAGSRRGAKVVLCPPFIYLQRLGDLLKTKNHSRKFYLGAQDVFWENPPAGGGAYTGEISPAMLKNSGVKYVIVGHSERRRLGETDEMVNRKLKAALKAGLKPILCVGESREVRRRGTSAAKKFIRNQLVQDLRNVPRSALRASRLIVAYEPVWAISTEKGSRVDTPEDAAKMIRFIKDFLSKTYNLKPTVLYGGSVTSKNAAHFLKNPEIDGALVGGASIRLAEFKKIINN